MTSAEELKQLIESGIPDSEVIIKGEGDHFEAVVISDAFSGKTMVQQHRLVYETLGDRMQGDIHALALQTHTPESWSAQRRIQ